MPCPICANPYTGEDLEDSTELIDESCEFICDTGKKCKKDQVENGLCTLHQIQRIPVICLSCNGHCCKICYRKFFLELLEEPQCMHCHKAFDIEFLLGYDTNKIQRFSKSFIWGPWKDHREDVLLDQVLARLPDYQMRAAAELEADRQKAQISAVNDRIRELEIRVNKLLKKIAIYQEVEKNTEQQETELAKLKERIIKLKEHLLQINPNRRGRHAQVQVINNGEEQLPQDPEVIDKVAKTHGKCHVENCNGYINQKWECGICGTKVCSKCYCIKIKDHKCNPDDVESIKLMKQSAKPCPNCNQMIERTKGCSQMWCGDSNGGSGCHMFFDWNTGKLLKAEHAHNPEHMDWMLRNGQTLGHNFALVPNACGFGLEQITRLNISKEDKETFAEYLRRSNEILDEVRRFVDPIDRLVEKHALNYLKGKITKDELKKMIQRNYKASKKAQLANMRRSMYGDTVQQILRFASTQINDLPPGQNTTQIIKVTIEALENLYDYTEKNLAIIGDIFNSEKPHLSNTRFREELYSTNNVPKRIIKFIQNYTCSIKNGDHTVERLRTDDLEIYLYLTDTNNEYTFHNFLRFNSDWIPTKPQIVKAIEETKKPFPYYRSKYVAREFIRYETYLAESVKVFIHKQIFDRGCMNLKLTYRDELTAPDEELFKNRCKRKPANDLCICKTCLLIFKNIIESDNNLQALCTVTKTMLIEGNIPQIFRA